MTADRTSFWNRPWFNWLTGLSLIVFVTTTLTCVVTGFWSYQYRSQLQLVRWGNPTAGVQCDISLSKDMICFDRTWRQASLPTSSVLQPSFWSVCGFHHSKSFGVSSAGIITSNDTFEMNYDRFPLLSLPLAFVYLRRRWTAIKERRNSRKGLCRKCDYDLCATPNRCPECGQLSETGMASTTSPV